MAREVNIEIEFVKIGEIDNLNEKFNAEIRIVSQWTEYDVNDNQEYDPRTNWNPQIFVKNLINEAKENVRYETEILNKGKKITEFKTLKGQFWERMELYDVPFDMQELNIIAASRHPSNKIKLKTNTSDYYLMNKETIRTFTDQQKWKLFKIYKMKNELDRSQLENRKWKLFEKKNDEEKNLKGTVKKQKPKVVATCYVSRHPGYYMFNAFFLIFLITVSALTVFSIPKSTPNSRLQTTYTILLSSVSFKWVFNRSLPSVSYLTLLDKYSIFGIVYITLLASWHSIIGVYNKQWDDLTDQWMLLSFVGLFILGHLAFYIKYLIITKPKRELMVIEEKILATYPIKDDDEE